MLTVRVGGTWVQTIGPYADVTMSHIWPRGSEECSWRMRPGTFHPKLSTGGASVECFDGGVRVWNGRLAEPTATGEFSANGSWSEAAGVYAIDGAGNATNTPDTAIDAAIARGAVTWNRPASLSSVAWGTAGEPMRLLDLLDEAMAGLNKRWYVDANGAVRSSADPTTPTYHVSHAAAGYGLTLAEDDYYSNLVGTYLAAGPVFAALNVHLKQDGTGSTNPADGDNPAKARWGYQEALVDLTAMGVITAGTAFAECEGRLKLTGARLGFAESLNLGHGEITTPGGTPVTLTMPRAGQMVRLMGVADRTRPAGTSPNTDVVIGRSEYRDGAATVTLTPQGKASRDLRELLIGAVA